MVFLINRVVFCLKLNVLSLLVVAGQPNSKQEISFLINIYPLVAQLVEQLPFKEMVVGSIPTERTILKSLRNEAF